MQSDYYIIMAGADRGSTNAIQKLCEMIPEWYKKTVNNTFHKVQRNAGPMCEQLRRQYPFHKKAPKFLGIVLGNWKSMNNHPEPESKESVFSKFSQGLSCDMPSNKYKATMNAQWQEAMNSRQNLEGKTFREDPDGFDDVVHFALRQDVYDSLNLLSCLIGRVRNFAGLKVNSEHFGIPVPFLEAKHLNIEWNGDGIQTKQKRPTPKNTESVEFFRKVFDQIAWNILALIHKDSSSTGRPWVNKPKNWSKRKLGGKPDESVHTYITGQEDSEDDVGD